MKTLAWLFGATLVLTGCDQPNTFQAPPPPEVTVASPVQEDVTLFEVFPGQIQARDQVQLVARVSGILQEIHFTDGAMVSAGDLLFTIEPEVYEAGLKAARAHLAQMQAGQGLAEASLLRKKKAYESRAVSELDVLSAEADLEAANAALDAARAAVEQAELQLSYTRITAPMDGVMSKATMSVGNLVGPGAVSGLAQLVRVDVANVVFSVDERSLLPRLRERAEAVGKEAAALPEIGLELADGDLYALSGQIDYLDPVIDAATGTLQVRAVFDNPDRLLLDGMFARVRIPVPVSDALLVPERAIQRDLVGPHVYVLTADNTVEAAYLELGGRLGDRRIVEDGLAVDARVVVRGIQRVRPGMQVKPTGGE